MTDDRKDPFSDADDELPDGWDDEEDMEEDEGFIAGFDALVSQYIGYEVELKGDNPVHVRIVRPSTPTSAAILVGVYSDCLVVLDHESYTIIPQALLVVSVPRAEWESNEWTQEE